MVLIILFIGHHLFGIWGMVPGVPVAQYLFQDVLGLRQTLQPPPANGNNAAHEHGRLV